MSVNFEKKEVNENNELEMELTINSDEAKEAYKKVCKKLSLYVNIPGFRKGKAPANILEKHLGKDYIQREVIESLIPNIFKTFFITNKYEIINEPKVDSFNFEDDGSIKVSASVELKPQFTLPEYKALELPIKKFSQPEDALEKELKDIQSKNSTLKKAEGRVTNENDLVNIDFDGYVDGEPIKGGKAKGYVLDLAHSNFIPGFAEQLVGKEVNSEFTIQVKFPEEYHDETIKGKDAEFKIKINDINERVYPELDDEFAKKIGKGKYDTLEGMKNDIQIYLSDLEKSENERRATTVLYEKLLELTDIKIQPQMIQREISAMYYEMQQRAMLQGQDFEKLLKEHQNDEFGKEMENEAVRRIKTALIIGEIAKNENIKVENTDIETKIIEISRLYNTTAEAVVSEMRKNPNMLQYLTQQIMSQKVTKFLLDNAKITDKTEDK